MEWFEAIIFIAVAFVFYQTFSSSTNNNNPSSSTSNNGPKMVHEITSEKEFEEIIAQNELVVVDFYATWCGPCKMIAPYIENTLAPENTNVKFVKVNVDNLRSLVEKYEVTAMPTFVYIRKGQVVKSVRGAAKAAVAEGVTALTSS
ncbi:thioredoxin trx1 [Dimargaris verticillata]|uniref:Thioredoxin trx1 n=1 Tax=Dimargaris verticillata TaxID=2761393 RepID=A0A9W8B3D9_9FUNG|nr:thioredoxin trx1 [Dimargaris verticillata]